MQELCICVCVYARGVRELHSARVYVLHVIFSCVPLCMRMCVSIYVCMCETTFIYACHKTQAYMHPRQEKIPKKQTSRKKGLCNGNRQTYILFTLKHMNHGYLKRQHFSRETISREVGSQKYILKCVKFSSSEWLFQSHQKFVTQRNFKKP
jgi:hypothetical protein